MDPTTSSLWRPIHVLLANIDDDIAKVYAGTNIRPSYVMELLRLHYAGPMTIRELADSVQRTHSAMSQKIAAMKAAGLVTTSPGVDARSKKITLTPTSAAIVDRLAAEWRATEAVIEELEAEVPYPLNRVVADIEAALARRSFHDRIAEKLAEDPAWR